MDAYKGAGAFFTMQNLIRFHGCTAIDDSGRRLDKYQSLAFLSAKAEEYKNGEKPYRGGTFQVLGDSNYYNVDLYWPKSKVMIFCAESDEEYTIAAKSEWKCFYLGSQGTTADSIVSMLKEK